MVSTTYDPDSGAGPGVPDVNEILHGTIAEAEQAAESSDTYPETVSRDAVYARDIHQWSCGEHSYTLAYLFTPHRCRP